MLKWERDKVKCSMKQWVRANIVLTLDRSLIKSLTVLYYKTTSVLNNYVIFTVVNAFVIKSVGWNLYQSIVKWPDVSNFVLHTVTCWQRIASILYSVVMITINNNYYCIEISLRLISEYTVLTIQVLVCLCYYVCTGVTMFELVLLCLYWCYTYYRLPAVQPSRCESDNQFIYHYNPHLGTTRQ